MGSKKNFIEKKICKVIELGKLYTSMIFFPKNLNSFIGEYAKNRAKSSLKILSFPAAPSLKKTAASWEGEDFVGFQSAHGAID